MQSIFPRFLLIFSLLLVTNAKLQLNNQARPLKQLPNAESSCTPAQIVIVNTVDGSLHALHRSTGELLWSRVDSWGPMVKVVDYPSKNTDLTETLSPSPSPSSKQLINIDQSTSENGVYIPEPGGNGDLYHYAPGQPIKKLPISLKKIVEEKPAYVSEGEIYTTKKVSRLLAIDPLTGQILAVFGESADEDINSDYVDNWDPNSGAIFIGRTRTIKNYGEYMLSIRDIKTSKLKWNITYGEFDSSDPSKLFRGKLKEENEVDIRVIPDNVLLFRNRRDQNSWMYRFEFPPLQVFQILVDYQFQHPFRLSKIYPPDQKTTNFMNRLMGKTAFVGSVDGSFYLLSAENFPQKTIDGIGSSSSQDQVILSIGCDPESGDPSCLVGQSSVTHEIQNILKSYSDQDSRLYLSFVIVIFSLLFMLWRRNRSSKNGIKSHTDTTSTSIQESSGIQSNEATTNDAIETPKKRRRRNRARKKIDLSKNGEEEGEESVDEIQTVVEEQIQKPDLEGDQVQSLKQKISSSSELRSLNVSENVLGLGSHGTVVFKGTFEGRNVAIKRLLLDFYDVAHHEVEALQDSDHHPNVIRYFYKEQSDKFMYIALELCSASLQDVIEKNEDKYVSLRALMDPKRILNHIMRGIHFLHSMKIVHRDIKPQNILIGDSKSKIDTHPRILISDFGLCKRLADDQSSFHNTIGNLVGTVGWRAPESMLASGALKSNKESSSEGWTEVTSTPMDSMRLSKKIDIFSAGCLFYYVLSGGFHPFGDRFSREINILKGNHRLDKLDGFGEEGALAKDLIRRMITRDPKKRPDAEVVLLHPYFWSFGKRLAFLCDVSDRWEGEERDPPTSLHKQLERNAQRIIGDDWRKRLDPLFVEDLGKYRKYDTDMIRDLLRAMRNKRNHYQDLNMKLKEKLGQLPDQFLQYFTDRFPGLFLHVYNVVSTNEKLRGELVFRPYFELKQAESW